MKKGMWKRLAATTMAGLMALSLAGCSGGGDKTSETTAAQAAQGTEKAETTTQASEGGGTEQQVTIKFLHDWPEYETQFNKIISDFEAANPDIKIETTVITWDVLTKTLQTAFASGDAPDVTCCWLDRIGGFNALGACYDLTDVMEENGSEWKNDFIQASLDLGTVNGRVLGVPFRSTCTVLVYNKTMMEENGWEEPKSQAELVELMDKAAQKGIIPLITPGNPEGFQLASVTKTVAEPELYKAGKLTSEEYLSGRLSDVSAEYEAAGNKIKDWISKGYIDKNALALTKEEASAQFYTGKGLIYFMNNNELAAVEENAKEAGFELGFMAFPPEEGVPTLLYNYGVDGWMVYSGTEYPEQSIRFLKYLSSLEVQQAFGEETLSVMGNKNCKYENENQNKFVEIFSKANSYRIKFDYSQGALLTDEVLAIADFIADDSKTGADLGETIADLKQKCIEENAE